MGTVITEVGLAADFGVSRTPAREAIQRLLAEGLFERHGRSVRVTVLRPEEVLDIYEVRIALEGVAGRAAAERRTTLDLGRLHQCVEIMRNLDPDREEQRSRLAHAFHFALWEAAHNRVLVDALSLLQRRVDGLTRTTVTYPGRWEALIDEAAQLVKVIEAREVELAGKMAMLQMERSRDIRVKLYSVPMDTIRLAQLPA
jgi:DNA-binding GntR family transcriptional regulator